MTMHANPVNRKMRHAFQLTSLIEPADIEWLTSQLRDRFAADRLRRVVAVR